MKKWVVRFSKVIEKAGSLKLSYRYEIEAPLLRKDSFNELIEIMVSLENKVCHKPEDVE